MNRETNIIRQRKMLRWVTLSWIGFIGIKTTKRNFAKRHVPQENTRKKVIFDKNNVFM